MSLSHGTVLAATDNGPLARTSRQQDGSRHPPGLLLLWVIEGCERFAATSLGSLLVLYMTAQRGTSTSDALGIIGNFNALCYLVPIVGGILTDHLLGSWRAMVGGMIFMAAAYGVLGLGTPPSLMGILVLLVAGHGLFKPSINGMLSSLYNRGDYRRGAAHRWFYFAANVGCMIAPLVSSDPERAC